MTKFNNRPVFICGHPKAGTSLITSLLDGHPSIVAYPEETLYFRRFLPSIKEKTFSESLDLANKLLIHIFDWNLESPPEHQRGYPDRDYSDIDAERVREKFQAFLSAREVTEKDYLEAAIFAFGKASQVLNEESQYWVEKTPYNEFYTELIFDWWPEARCIHILRDPRDNFVSYKRKQSDWTAKKFAWNWVRSTEAGLANSEKFSSSQYLLIRFEDLLRDARSVTQKIASFLEIQWREELLEPTRVGDSWRGNSMFGQKFQQISTAPIGRWKEGIDSVDLAIIQTIAREEMEAAGYPLVKPDLEGVKFSKRFYLWGERFITWGKKIL